MVLSILFRASWRSLGLFSSPSAAQKIPRARSPTHPAHKCKVCGALPFFSPDTREVQFALALPFCHPDRTRDPHHYASRILQRINCMHALLFLDSALCTTRATQLALSFKNKHSALPSRLPNPSARTRLICPPYQLIVSLALDCQCSVRPVAGRRLQHFIIIK